MTRLDNSMSITEVMFGVVDYDEDDPGKSPPVDLCFDCYVSTGEDLGDAEHPDYDDGRYFCTRCGRRLVQAYDG